MSFAQRNIGKAPGMPVPGAFILGCCRQELSIQPFADIVCNYPRCDRYDEGN